MISKGVNDHAGVDGRTHRGPTTLGAGALEFKTFNSPPRSPRGRLIQARSSLSMRSAMTSALGSTASRSTG